MPENYNTPTTTYHSSGEGRVKDSRLTGKKKRKILEKMMSRYSGKGGPGKNKAGY